jgi:xanthine dehydrogenase accessory factor
LGKSVIGRALIKIAKAADYRLTVVAEDASAEIFPEADTIQTHFDLSKMAFNASTFVVVATQGDNDEKALAAALSIKCRYVAFISSRKKRDTVFENLKQQGISVAQLNSIHAPAGLDINAKTHEEVAISILAEIIQEFRTKEVAADLFKKEQAKPKQPEAPLMITNPVCGMPISKGMRNTRLSEMVNWSISVAMVAR